MNIAMFQFLIRGNNPIVSQANLNLRRGRNSIIARHHVRKQSQDLIFIADDDRRS